VLLAAVLLAAWPGTARPAPADGTAPGDPLVAFGPGWGQILDAEPVAMGWVELRPDTRWWIFRPWFGLESSGDETFTALGVQYDWAPAPWLRVTPNFGVGVFHQASGFELGLPLEFRSTLEVTWRLPGGQRLGASFGHISNAGLGDHNPGTELLKVVLALPTR
jgi:hypothetical protein